MHKQYDLALAEFPDWDASLGPPIPLDWVPTSWHNDGCPSWRVFPARDLTEAELFSADLLVVFVDHLYPLHRKVPTLCRYQLTWQRADHTSELVIDTDNWDQLLHVARLQVKRKETDNI